MASSVVETSLDCLRNGRATKPQPQISFRALVLRVPIGKADGTVIMRTAVGEYCKVDLPVA